MMSEERLEKLEGELTRAKRRSRRLLVAVGLAIAAGLMFGLWGSSYQQGKQLKSQQAFTERENAKEREHAAALQERQERAATRTQQLKAEEAEKVRERARRERGQQEIWPTGARLALRGMGGAQDHLPMPPAMFSESLAAKPAQVMRATAFVLVDDKGRERGKLEMGVLGPQMGLYEEKGKLVWSAP